MPRSAPELVTVCCKVVRSVAPQPTLMFVPSGSEPIAVDLGAEPLEGLRRDPGVGAVRAVDDDLQAGQVGAEALDDVVEVALGRDADVVDLARRGRSNGASKSASISSSAASVSLRPSPSKNLTPLYSGGLCDAEMTAPRSSASSATAGVGSTPASTALPPAATTPRANASSSSGPEPRVSRPTKTRPPLRPERRRAAEPLDELGRQLLADDAADPVGTEVAAAN